MDHKIAIGDKIKVNESIAWELEIDAIVFRDEFDYYLKKFETSKSGGMVFDKMLVFVFMMLQIYIEYFLHQNMRRIISLEFKETDKNKYNNWIKNERRYIPDKKSDKGKLFLFLEYYSLDSDPKATKAKEEIEAVFNELAKIRNELVHGHKMSISGNADSSLIEVSETMGYLAKDVLVKIIERVNNLGENWNKLLDIVFDKCKALKKIDDFKFDSLDYKK